MINTILVFRSLYFKYVFEFGKHAVPASAAALQCLEQHRLSWALANLGPSTEHACDTFGSACLPSKIDFTTQVYNG